MTVVAVAPAPIELETAVAGTRMQRSDGACALTVGPLNGRTRIVDLYQSSPCRALMPLVDDDEIFSAVMVTTSGGLAGGDKIRVSVTAETGARAVVTSQASEKIYRSLGDDTRVSLTLTAAADTWLEWIPQGAILFDNSRLVRRNVIDADVNARVMAGEIVVFGRTASGETFHNGLFHDAWQVRVGGKLVWADAVRLDHDIEAVLAHPAGFGGAVAMATVLFVGPDAAQRVDLARRLCAPECGKLSDDCGKPAAVCGKSGATVVNGVLVVRFLNSDAQALMGQVAAFWRGFRSGVAGLPARMPRVWQY